MKIINLRDFIGIGFAFSFLFFTASFGLFYHMHNPEIQPETDLVIGFLATFGFSFGFGFKLGYDFQTYGKKCIYCNKKSEFSHSKKQWLGCGHTI